LQQHLIEKTSGNFESLKTITCHCELQRLNMLIDLNDSILINCS